MQDLLIFMNKAGQIALCIMLSVLLYSSCREVSSDDKCRKNCGFINTIGQRKERFSEEKWHKCSNMLLRQLGGADEEANICLALREEMLCSMLDNFLNKATLDSLLKKLGDPIMPNSILLSSCNNNKGLSINNYYNYLYYPVGLSGSGANCLILYFNKENIFFDYEILIAQ